MAEPVRVAAVVPWEQLVDFAQRAYEACGVPPDQARDAADGVVKEIEASGGTALAALADVTDEAAVSTMVEQAVKKFGRLDIIVNNAARRPAQTIEETSLDLWQRTLDTNLTSAFLVTRRSIPHLRKSGSGRIVNVLTLSTQTGGANGAGAYSIAAAKLTSPSASQAYTLTKVPKGDYTLYAEVSNPDAWQLVISKQTGQWGLTYDAKQDLGRVKMTMSKPPALVEQYKVTLSTSGANAGALRLEWENHVATVPIRLK